MKTLLILTLTLVASSLRAAEPVPLALAKDGQALQSVIVAKCASERTRLAAAELADYLGRITGARFSVEPGDGSTGLAVGPHTDFPALKLAALFESGNPFRLDDYLLRTHAHGAYLVGANDGAALRMLTPSCKSAGNSVIGSPPRCTLLTSHAYPSIIAVNKAV